MASSQELRIALVGYNFMGKAHTHAFRDAAFYFDLPRRPVLTVICGRDKKKLEEARRKFGFAHAETDYRRVVARKDVDLVDIATPNASHCEIAVAAARAGKHVACEKPIAMNVDEARRMFFEVREAGVRHMVWFNYRRAPAVTLLREMVASGELGEIHHFRATYLQDWLLDPGFPLVWRLDRRVAGSGAHGDLNAHIVDLGRWIVGEIDEVVGQSATFVRQRPLSAESSGLAGRARASAKGPVTVDDATIFLARFRNGALGSFEATRFAAGRKNYNRIEVNGSKGSAVFNLERMNELEVYRTGDPEPVRGFRAVMVTEATHPYIRSYWPPGHTIGYEHTFVNQAADLVRGIADQTELRPDFEDGLRCQEVLDAVVRSCEERRWEKVGLVPNVPGRTEESPRPRPVASATRNKRR